MPIKVGTTRQILADAYKAAGTWLNAATADPGTAAAPASEATGGSPANARKQTAWTSGVGGTLTGTAVVVDLAAGTYAWALLASAVSGANMIDNVAMTATQLTAQGQIVMTPSFTVT